MSDKHDPVNNPSHYTSDQSGIECIEITENWDFLLGNTLKYMWRHGKKSTSDSIEDLEKARWYLDRKINKLKSEARAKKIKEYTDRAKKINKLKSKKRAKKINKLKSEARAKKIKEYTDCGSEVTFILY